ncbi:hypothetical protein SDC9_184511 [bioreactor metagenome]|uniref:Uncharacterized protein n=1 Tax=bioreactor metagenome TaxID=1076179 RepID=A0A645HFQ5_9ZZZZ
MKFLLTLTTLCGATLLLSGAELKLRPEADGMLIDSDGDGVVNTVLVHTDKRDLLELLTGKLGNGIHRSALEYRIPENIAISKATLTLTLNGKTGCHPDTPGNSGPATTLWIYGGPEANGKIELADDGAGEKVAVVLTGSTVDVSKPIVVDVTAQLKQLAAAKSAWVGFRLEADDETNAKSTWRVRSAEFARRYAASSYPTLTIITE